MTVTIATARNQGHSPVSGGVERAVQPLLAADLSPWPDQQYCLPLLELVPQPGTVITLAIINSTSSVTCLRRHVPGAKLAVQTNSLLTQWLITHVTGLDKDLTGYINEARTRQWEEWLVSQF